MSLYNSTLLSLKIMVFPQICCQLMTTCKSISRQTFIILMEPGWSLQGVAKMYSAHHVVATGSMRRRINGFKYYLNSLTLFFKESYVLVAAQNCSRRERWFKWWSCKIYFPLNKKGVVPNGLRVDFVETSFLLSSVIHISSSYATNAQ